MRRSTWVWLLAAISVACTPTRFGAGTPPAPCCEGKATCLPSVLVEPRSLRMLERATCAESDVCVPNELSRGLSLSRCQLPVTNAEGRCLSECLPTVRAQLDKLERSSCDDGQRCAPCYDPISGAATGACNVGEDEGPTGAPGVFASCCNELGRCVPDSLIESAQRDVLGKSHCAGAAERCVPNGFLADPHGYVAATCVSSIAQSEGRCLPACLPKLAAQATTLVRDGCQDGELCAPCFDPVSGEATGSCKLAGDPGPREPAHVFATCCGARGRCLPSASLPAEQRDSLAADSCGDTERCVPSALVSNPARPPDSCDVAALGAEGRCLSDCLPLVAARADLLTRESCQDHERCVPCFDPVSGTPTGSCSQPGDPGPKTPPTTLAECCDGAGRCAPEAYVPEALRSRFDSTGCSASGSVQLCVAPVAALSNPEQFVAASCHDTTTHAEGRCLPRCLPAVAARAAQLSAAECTSSAMCVPCFDPVSGAATGACDAGADPGPREPKVVFAPCCMLASEPQGLCVPGPLIPKNAPALPRDSCASVDSSCVPRSVVDPSRAAPHACQSLLVSKGLCLPECFLTDQALGTLLPQGDCAAAERCVSCDQLSGTLPGC